LYTIMGITGRVGGVTARALLAAGKKVRGVVRDKAKAAAWEKLGVELVVAKATDVAALTKAFQGAEGVFVMNPPCFTPAPGYPEAREIGGALRQAIEASRPPCVVGLSSIGGQHDHGTGLIVQCHILEEELAALPVPMAFVRAGWFMENSASDVASARQQGQILGFLDPLDRAFPMVATEDIGDLIASVLQQDWNGKRILELEGPQRYSTLDAAATFSRLLKRLVVAKTVPHDEWAAVFESQGMPADRTAPRIEMVDGFNSGWIEFERKATEHFRGKRALEEVLQDLIGKNA
jgi:NAD(P)H dehydrogenase (quinone)